MNIRLITGIVAAGLFTLCFVACDRPPSVLDDKMDALGSFAEITIAGLADDKAREAVRVVEQRLAELDKVGYTFNSEGELHRLNEAISQGRSIAVSAQLRELIEISTKLSSTSNGLFNPAAGELTALWEFHCESDNCIEAEHQDEVKRLLQAEKEKVVAQHPSMDDLVLSGNTVTSGNPAVKLEFGDIIRGYALDKGLELLKEMGIANAMIDIGGSIRSVGTRGEHPWWAPVLDADGEHSVGYIELDEDEAIVTVRAFDRSVGRRDFVYRHVVDPRSGMPVTDLKSVTVIHAGSAAGASAAAMSLLVAGMEEWDTTAGNMGVRAIMMVTKEGTVYTSTAMEERIHWSRRREHQHLVP